MEFYQEETNKLRRMIVWLVDIIVVISLAWFVVYGFGTQIRITGQSMTPELRSEDVVLMNRLSYDLGSPKRFDVVVFEREDKKPNVKRVIGLPGETVQIKNGQIYIDDKPLEADKGLDQVSLAGLAENPVVLEEDEYFIADLIGINVTSDEGEELGTIKDVLQTGANDVYVIAKENTPDLLVPAIHDCVLAVDIEAQTMTVHLLEGLR